MLSSFYSKFIKKDKIVKVFGKSLLVVVTGSMEPTIKAGELIIISEEKNYKKDDIVTYFDKDGYLITHRIIRLFDDSFITKGDGNNIEDEENSVNQIEGKVIMHSRLLGFFTMYLLKPLVIFYIIILIISYIYKLLKKDDENGKR